MLYDVFLVIDVADGTREHDAHALGKALLSLPEGTLVRYLDTRNAAVTAGANGLRLRGSGKAPAIPKAHQKPKAKKATKGTKGPKGTKAPKGNGKAPKGNGENIPDVVLADGTKFTHVMRMVDEHDRPMLAGVAPDGTLCRIPLELFLDEKAEFGAPKGKGKDKGKGKGKGRTVKAPEDLAHAPKVRRNGRAKRATA